MRTLIFCLLCFFSFAFTKAQEPKYIIKNYDCPSIKGAIWNVAQDSLGYLYFGLGSGISIYNGNEWDYIEIGYITTRCIYKDSKNNLWYGSVNDFGKIKKSRTLGTYAESIVKNLPSSQKVFGDIWTINDINGNLFFQSKNQIFIYNEKDGLKSYNIENTYHRAIVADSLYIINKQGVGLFVFRNKEFTPLHGGDFYKDKIISGSVNLGFDTILIGTRASGVFKYNIKTGVTSPAFTENKETNNFFIQNQLYCMINLPENNVAISTLQNGTLIIDLKGKILKHFNTQSGTNDNKHYALYLTSDNNLWMCTNIGCSVIDINSPLSLWDKNLGLDGIVLSMEQYNNGILAGSSAGLFYLPQPFTSTERIKKILNTEVWALKSIKNSSGQESILAGTSDGMYQVKADKTRQIHSKELILNLLQLNLNTNYLLAFTSCDVLVFHISDLELKFLGKIYGLCNEVCTVSQTGNKYIWLVTRSNQAIRINQEQILSWLHNKEIVFNTKKINLGLINSVIEYKNQSYFINKNGLYIYNEKTDTLAACKLFGDEFFNVAECIVTLKEDNSGNIWLGGNKVLLNRPDGSYSLYYLPYEDFKNMNDSYVIMHDKNGKTWIGGEKGIFHFDKPIIPVYHKIYPVVINRIVSNDSIYYIYENANSKDIFTHNVNQKSDISIHYSLPIYSSNEDKIYYSYFLEGHSKKWSKWNTQGYTDLTNLKPGSYIFKVKAKLKFNIETEITCINLNVEKLWYQTILAYTIYVLISITLILSLLRIYINSSLKRKLKGERFIREKIQQNNLIVRTEHSGVNSNCIADKIITDGQTEFSNKEEENNEFIYKVLIIINSNLEKSDFNVDQLCKAMNMNQTMLYRKIKSYTGLSISSFIRKVRLKNSLQLLYNSGLTISEIAYKVGFNDPGYFTKCFTREYGDPPSLIQQYKKEEKEENVRM